MTDAEIMKAVALRLRGATYSEIGEILRYDGTTVRYALKKTIFYGSNNKCIHPHVRMWMLRHGICNMDIAKQAGVSTNTVSRNLRAEEISTRISKAIIKMSGLTLKQVQYVESGGNEDGR